MGAKLDQLAFPLEFGVQCTRGTQRKEQNNKVDEETQGYQANISLFRVFSSHFPG